MVNNKENATSRAVRASTRAKPPSNTADPKAATHTRITASTIATRAKTNAAAPSRADPSVQVKRKREALGEVPRPPANIVRQDKESTTGAKGKGKATKETFDGVELKKPTVIARPPLKVVASARKTTVTTTTTTTTRRTRSITAAAVKEEVPVQHPRLHERSHPVRLPQVKEEVPHNEDAMVIDHIAPIPAPRALSARRPPAVTATARRDMMRRAQAARAAQERDEDEYTRAYKKQRTSSEAPEDELAEVEEAVRVKEEAYVEREVDPETEDWDDLDAEDKDDPLMVSEYVVDIFNYLKEVEVSHYSSSCFFLSSCPSKRPCRTRTTWRCRRT